MISKNILKKGKSIIHIEGDLKENYYKISTDSRKYQKGELFLALKGEHFDGFTYGEDILKKGCQAVIFNKNSQNTLKKKELLKKYNICYIEVEDSTKYFQDIARLHIKDWKKQNSNAKIIGITGSNGKTTTKEMLYHLLNKMIPGKVHCSWGNYNNHIGVPITISGIEKKHDIAIIEMGTNHPGEIATLCKIASPDSGIITSIGKAHLEFFKSERNIFKEKRTLFDYVKKNNPQSPFVVDGDDPFLKDLPDTEGLVKYSQRTVSITSEKVVINNKDTLNNKYITGKHNFKNLTSAFILSSLLYPKKKEALIKACTAFIPQNNRSVWLEFQEGRVFLDAYNANPSSMRAALYSFFDYCKENEINLDCCFFILGDMNELGEFASNLHQEIGSLLNQLGGVHVCFIGKYRDSYSKGYGKEHLQYASLEEFLLTWQKVKRKYQYFFIKASRSLELEMLLESTDHNE